MTRLPFSAAFSYAILSAVPAHAGGIPTFDGAAVANGTAQLLQLQQAYQTARDQLGTARNQLSEAVKTVTALRTQIDQLQRQFESITGSRGMGALLNGDADRAARRIADSLDRINGLLFGDGSSGASPLAPRIAEMRRVFAIPEAATLFDPERAPAKVAAHDFANESTVTAIALSEASFARANGSVERIEALLGAVDTAPDLKAAIDLNTRMLAELAFMMADRTRLDAGATQMQAALANERLRDRETGKRRLEFKE